MKKLLLLGASVLLAGAAHAQFGLKAGVAATVFRVPDGYRARQMAGYQAGVFYEQKLGPHWSVQPELQYARQGAQVFRPGGRAPGDTYQARLHYLLLPVLAKWRYARFYVEAGPQAGYLLAAREQGTQVVLLPTDGFYFVHYDRRTTAGYHRLDLSAAVGAGVAAGAGLSAGVRYTAGLNHLNSDAVQNRTLQVYLSYQLRSRRAGD